MAEEDSRQRRTAPGIWLLLAAGALASLALLLWPFLLALSVAAVIAVINPPTQLQDLIVYASGGLGGCFLATVFLALYWPRCTGGGVIAGMVTGFAIHTSLAVAAWFIHGSFKPIPLFDLHPFVWALLGSTVATVITSIANPPPDENVVRRFFG